MLAIRERVAVARMRGRGRDFPDALAQVLVEVACPKHDLSKGARERCREDEGRGLKETHSLTSFSFGGEVSIPRDSFSCHQPTEPSSERLRAPRGPLRPTPGCFFG